MSAVIVQKDLAFGNKCEKTTKTLLEDYFNSSLSKTPYRHEFDWVDEDNKIYIELKSRRNTKLQYPTTMIGYNKIIKANELIKQGYTIYLCFLFTDKLTFYHYTEETFDKSWIKKGGRWDRGRSEIKEYVYIPVKLLKDINI